MKLFLISQDSNIDYDTYDSAVVAAPDEETARHMNPFDGEPMTDEDWREPYSAWCRSPDLVKVEYLGETDKPQGIICASFNAG